MFLNNEFTFYPPPREIWDKGITDNTYTIYCTSYIESRGGDTQEWVASYRSPPPPFQCRRVSDPKLICLLYVLYIQYADKKINICPLSIPNNISHYLSFSNEKLKKICDTPLCSPIFQLERSLKNLAEFRLNVVEKGLTGLKFWFVLYNKRQPNNLWRQSVNFVFCYLFHPCSAALYSTTCIRFLTLASLRSIPF